MRTRTKSIVAAFVLLSLVSGAIGCRSNGGPWYNPKSYAWHNPFKSGEAPPYGEEGTAQVNQKPSLDAQPNVNTPPGGYSNREDEARFLAGKKETVMVPQYGVTTGATENNRIASSAGSAAPQSVYPETPYNPYAVIDNTATAGITPQPGVYQGTNLHTATPQTTGAYPGMVPQDPMTYPGSVPAPSNVPAAGYSPYAAPVSTVPEAAPIYGNPAATNTAVSPYAQPAPPQSGYAAQPSTSQSYAAPQHDYQSVPQQGYGTPAMTNPYTATPSTYPAAMPQGF